MRQTPSTLPPPCPLTCCCCGEPTIGRQWSNRDTGYGLCPRCADWIRARRTSPSEMQSLYGTQGVHYDIQTDPTTP